MEYKQSTLNQRLIYNFFIDFKKKEIDNLERANLLNQYVKEKNISIREFSRQTGIPNSTLQDWLLWLKIDHDDYKKMKRSGMNDTDIYRTLRDNKEKPNKEIIQMTKLDFELKNSIKSLTPLIKNKSNLSDNTFNLMSELRDILNRIEMYIEKERGN